MTGAVERLVAAAEDDAGSPEQLTAALTELLAVSPAIGAAVALGLLARPPRVRPSRALLIDPGDDALRRWRRRVVAAAVLQGSPAVGPVIAELRDELADDPDLAAELRTLGNPPACR